MTDNTKVPVGYKSEDELVAIATAMWKDAKKHAKSKEFVDMNDDDRLDLFREKLNYEEFMNEFPVMCRYMICLGQYSKKAFTRFMKRVSVCKKNDSLKPREKGYKEDQWVRRQADYVRFLWEDYNKGHPNLKDGQAVWDEAYNNLKNEFDDFRKRYADVEINRKAEAIELRAESAREMITRLISNNDNIPNDEVTALRDSLRSLVYNKRFKLCMEQIDKTVPIIKHCVYGFGKAKVEKVVDNNNKVIMIEH